MRGQAGLNLGKDLVERIWRREGLKVPQKPRGLWLSDVSCAGLRPLLPDVPFGSKLSLPASLTDVRKRVGLNRVAICGRVANPSELDELHIPCIRVRGNKRTATLTWD